MVIKISMWAMLQIHLYWVIFSFNTFLIKMLIRVSQNFNYYKLVSILPFVKSLKKTKCWKMYSRIGTILKVLLTAKEFYIFILLRYFTYVDRSKEVKRVWGHYCNLGQCRSPSIFLIYYFNTRKYCFEGYPRCANAHNCYERTLRRQWNTKVSFQVVWV